ncbi:hypothetical protein ACHAWF_011779 [Thalassiosira exigua]
MRVNYKSKTAERKKGVSYDPMVVEESHGPGRRSFNSCEQNPTPMRTVQAIATPVPFMEPLEQLSGRMSGITAPSGMQDPLGGRPSEVSGLTSEGNPWENIGNYAQEIGGKGRVSVSVDTPMTDLHGPDGTSGKDPRSMDQDQFSNLLREGYSSGLARALTENARRFDFRFWVIDNSGSMQIGDGHRIVEAKGGKSKAVECTRWEEIKETVKYHAQMACALDSPAIFQLLNDPGLRTVTPRFSVGEHGESSAQVEANRAIEIMRRVSPRGVTPLTQHIWDIQRQISGMAGELRRSGKMVAIIIATDGLPTDHQGFESDAITNEFIGALRALEGLPVWTVIRLCTDEAGVRRFYNSLDQQLEISLEVLDDYIGGEARSFCAFILGLDEHELPGPGADPASFLESVKTFMDKEQMQWNPIKKKMTPWLLTKELKRSFASRHCVIM